MCSKQSTQTNKSRLRLLQAREQHLQDLFSTAREQVTVLSKDEGRYTQLLEGVIVQVRSPIFRFPCNLILSVVWQGLLQLLEPSATVYSRPKDEAIAKKAAENASKQYKEISGKTVEVSVESTLQDDG